MKVWHGGYNLVGMAGYSLYIFDLDGTLFRGGQPTPGAQAGLAELRSRGAQIRFVTNNSTRLAEEFASKLVAMGIHAQPSEVVTSAMGAAHYLSGLVRTAFVVGESGLRATLMGAGIDEADDHPGAVVVGLCRSFDYGMMARAMHHLLSQDVLFVATNRDASYPMEGGTLIPGAGSIVAALATCSGREPLVIGKPSPLLLEMAMASAQCPASETLVIGDRLDTDIEAGRRAGCDVHLVLCGVETSSPSGIPFSPDVRGVLARQPAR